MNLSKASQVLRKLAPVYGRVFGQAERGLFVVSKWFEIVAR